MKLLIPLTSPHPTPSPTTSSKRNLQFSPQMNFWLLTSRVQAAYKREHKIEIGLWTASSRIYTRVHSGNELRLDTQVHGQTFYIKQSARGKSGQVGTVHSKFTHKL